MLSPNQGLRFKPLPLPTIVLLNLTILIQAISPGSLSEGCADMICGYFVHMRRYTWPLGRTVSQRALKVLFSGVIMLFAR